MAGKKGMHDRLLSPQAAEHIRSKIKTSQLVNLLTEVAMTGEFQGKSVDTSRLKAAEILLRKALPDLNATELSGGVTTYRDTLTRIAEAAGWSLAASQVARENDTDSTQAVDSKGDAQVLVDGAGQSEGDPSGV